MRVARKRYCYTMLATKSKIFDTLDVEEADREEDAFKKAEKALRDYFTQLKIIEYEVYKFRQAKQLPRENITTYCTRLKQLARSCDFYDEKKEIKTQIIQNGISSKLRRKALSDPETTLEKLYRLQKQWSFLNCKQTVLNVRIELHINLNTTNHARIIGNKAKLSRSQNVTFVVMNILLAKRNHFKACCNDRQHGKGDKNNEQFRRNAQSRRRKQSTSRRGRVNNLNEEKSESSSEEYLFSTLTVGSILSPKKLPKFQVKVSGLLLTLLADTGASVNIFEEFSYAKLKTEPKFLRANEKIFPYGSITPLPVIGKCQCEMETGKKFSVETFFVVKGKLASCKLGKLAKIGFSASGAKR